MRIYMFYILIKLINNKTGECSGGEGIASGTVGSP
jgi:hypothetical protein